MMHNRKLDSRIVSFKSPFTCEESDGRLVAESKGKRQSMLLSREKKGFKVS